MDGIDSSLLDLLAERSGVVREVIQSKRDRGEAFVRDVARESHMLVALMAEAEKRGLDSFHVRRLFHEILDHSVRKQHHLLSPEGQDSSPFVVAYQGAEGAYSHMAATRHFGALAQATEPPKSVVYQAFDSFSEVVESVASGRATHGVLPIENTTAGSINEVYDLLAERHLHLVGEEVLPVRHCLIGLGPLSGARLRRVYSHPQALAQCARFLATLTGCTVEAFANTALAVKKVKEDQNLTQAAIASEEAARVHGLHVLQRDINDQPNNHTRMVVVARRARSYDERVPCKTSLIVRTGHHQGALVQCLNILADRGLNLCKLESRPMANAPWEYLFYLDFEGNLSSPEVRDALTEMRVQSRYLRVLGSYPARTTSASRPAEPQGAVSVRRSASSTSIADARDTPAVVRAGSSDVGGAEPVIVASLGEVRSLAEAELRVRAVRLAGVRLVRMRSCANGPTPEEVARLTEPLGVDVILGVPRVSQWADASRLVAMVELGATQGSHQEWLEAVHGTHGPVLVERPVEGGYGAWARLIEGIRERGNRDVVALDPGVTTTEGRALDLEGALYLRDDLRVPVLVDPCPTFRSNESAVEAARAILSSRADGVVLPVGEGALGADDLANLV